MVSQDLRLADGAPTRLGPERARAGLQAAAVVERVMQTVLGKMLEVSALPRAPGLA